MVPLSPSPSRGAVGVGGSNAKHEHSEFAIEYNELAPLTL
jgi:hypothetical protein